MKNTELWQNPLDKGLNPHTMWEVDRVNNNNTNNDE